MRLTTTLITTLLLIGAIPAMAAPVDYTINFTLASGSPLPASGSFDYDSSTSTFTNFVVAWDGDAFDLTAAANTSPYLGSYINQPCISSGSVTGPQEVFNLLTVCPAAYWEANGSSVSNSTPSFLIDVGAYNSISSYGIVALDPAGPTQPPTTAVGGFTAVPTPEPASYALMLLGLCLAMRKRIAAALRLTN